MLFYSAVYSCKLFIELVTFLSFANGVVVSVKCISCFFLTLYLLGVLSLVTVHPQSVAVGKQLLPKTLGPSNVNIAPQMVSTG